MLKRSVLIVVVQLVALAIYRLGVGFANVDPKLFELDISYLFSASWEELKQYFPNYYWLIFSLGRSVHVGLPLLVAYLLFLNRSWLDSYFLQTWKDGTRSLISAVLPFSVGLVFSLVVYFSLDLTYGAQLIFSRSFIGWALVDLLLFFVSDLDRTKATLKSFLLSAELPYSLAITRIIFFSYSALLCLHYYEPVFATNMGALDKVPLPYIGWLIDIVPVGPELYTNMCWVVVLSAFAVAIGFRTRMFLIIHAIAIFYVVATPNFFGKLAHHQIFIWISWIMAFSPCADVLSIDSLLNKKAKNIENRHYGFHLKIIWLHFGLVYFFAGFFKLWICGFDWIFTDSMVNQVQIEWFEHFDRLPEFRVDRFPWFLKAGGLVVIIFEVVFIFMLFNRFTKWLSVFGALLMHNIIGKVMYIGFVLFLQAFYVVFIPWNRLLTKLKLVSFSKLPHPQINFRSAIYLGPMLLLCANILAGFFNINSYPFSVYPVYAEIIPSNVKYLEYRPLDVGMENIDSRKEGKEVGFLWERYSRTEYHIIRMWKAGAGLDTVGVKTLWRRWQLESPKLNSIDSVQVFVVERPLQPERANERISEEYLMSIYRKKNDGK